MSESPEPTWLTQEAYDRLAAELDERSTSRRTEITRRIESAREEGDLRENAGYHAAKEDQGKNEARIRQLHDILQHAQIGAPDAHPDEVAQGKVVTILFERLEEEQTFLLASREEAAHASVEVFSPSSPLGTAILGKHVGDRTSYTLPNGSEMPVTIIRVEPYAV